MHDYARQKALGQYIGNWYDPLTIIHYVRERRGIALGNEAPGVMKKTTANLHPREVTIGLTHVDETFGFRQWLKPGESWQSTWVFIIPYSKTNDPSAVINGPVSDYVRDHMGIRLSEIKEKPLFVYNTWMPFRHDINENLIKELADAAAECGIEEFIIDDGWQTNYGDWGINPDKFPNGLKPVFDYIKQKGMKPGLWISLAAAEKTSEVYQQHPEWLVRKADGSPINLHADFDKMYEWETYSMSMASGWKEHIKSVILDLVKNHGLEYIKGDFAVATGAYTTDKTRSGDHNKNNPFYRDREESLLVLYQKTWELFDELHQEAPQLFIDCTFETMGAFQLIDYDMCKHAEGNWLSNFEEPAPFGSLRVRQMAWWRSPVIPATAMVIGNQQLDDPMIELSIKSLAGTLPILLGDPRKLSEEQRERIKQYGDWFKACQKHHNYLMFRQDLTGFGEPQEGNWDGFQRINTVTKSGGIVGVFRQGAQESQRQVFVNFLDQEKIYIVYEAPSGKEIARLNGMELGQKGFLVKFDNNYDGALFEIINK
jgi:alpha-galactosidase